MDAALEWILTHWDEITISILLIFILYGGSRREPWWVFGREFRDEKADKDEWKTLALSGTSLADRATSIAEKKAGNR